MPTANIARSGADYNRSKLAAYLFAGERLLPLFDAAVIDEYGSSVSPAALGHDEGVHDAPASQGKQAARDIPNGPITNCYNIEALRGGDAGVVPTMTVIHQPQRRLP